MYNVEIFHFDQVLGGQEPHNIAKIEEVGDGVMDIGDGIFIFEFGDLLVEGAYDKVCYFLFLVGLVFFGVVAENDIAFHIAGGFGKDCKLLDGFQR